MSFDSSNFRDLNQRFIFQGGSEFACALADRLERVEQLEQYLYEARNPTLPNGETTTFEEVYSENQRLRQQIKILNNHQLCAELIEAWESRALSAEAALATERKDTERYKSALLIAGINPDATPHPADGDDYTRDLAEKENSSRYAPEAARRCGHTTFYEECPDCHDDLVRDFRSSLK